MTISQMYETLDQVAACGENQLWVGTENPYSLTAIDIRASTNFRLHPSHHSAYDTVWCIESDLAALEPGQFELVVDELVRCIDGQGRLVLRYTQNSSVTVIALKKMLGRRYNTEVRIDKEWVDNGLFTTIFSVKREDRARYRDRSWTFAVLTGGTREEELDALFSSIRSQDTERNHQILVCGPALPQFEHYALDYSSGHEYRDEYGEISRKKNDLAKQATGSNLCIVHDRYRINEDFFAGFDAYGYDFDFCSVSQYYECGAIFPAYCAIANTDLYWDQQIHTTNYSSLLPRQYLNGGLLVFKTATLRDLKFNDLCFWQQGEDVEITDVFRQCGIPPRFNFHSSATTLKVTPEKTEAIRPFRCVEPELGGTGHNEPAATKRRTKLHSNIGRRIERRLRPILKGIKQAYKQSA